MSRQTIALFVGAVEKFDKFRWGIILLIGVQANADNIFPIWRCQVEHTYGVFRRPIPVCTHNKIAGDIARAGTFFATLLKSLDHFLKSKTLIKVNLRVKHQFNIPDILDLAPL